MDYRYPPGAVRRLDDALLSGFGERYVGLHGNAHRREPWPAGWPGCAATASQPAVGPARLRQRLWTRPT